MPMPPILVADLFPELTARLLALLRGLSPDEWHLPTVSSRRTVKDVAAHLLDGSLRRQSSQRDGYRPPHDDARPRDGEPLMDFLNRLNRDWEIAARRLSPRVLVDLIEPADAQLAAVFASLDPFAPAIFPVAWAGEDESANWMDVAREYTERWHHAQQIFLATNRPSTVLDRRLGRPCFDAFLRALPHAYRDVPAPPGSTVAVTVEGDAGGTWFVARDAAGWRQVPALPGPPTATVTLPAGAAWQLWTKRRPDAAAALAQFPGVQLHGDRPLGLPVLTMLAVMA